MVILTLLLSQLALADPLIVPTPQQLPGVTSVIDETQITVDMGLRMVPTNDPGDSLRWWERREAGYRRWLEAKHRFPRAKSPTVEIYLSGLAEGFVRTLPDFPRGRFHFYVTDTLNPSLWPAGGGFFVVHAGLLRQIRDERQFAFLLALELAHEVLGHNMTPIRAGDVKWEPGRWREGTFDSWAIEFWAALVGADPLDLGGFTYSLQQESDALELVYRFFRANAWEYDGINRLVVELLPTLNAVPGASSLPRLHSNLAMAIKLPHRRPQIGMMPIDSVINRASYIRSVHEIERSTLQHYPWMLELVPYRNFVLDRELHIDETRREYAEHSDRFSSKIEQTFRKSRYSSLKTELSEFLGKNDDLDARDKMHSARLARTYLHGLLLIAHRQWKEVITNAEEGLKLDASAEPFLWQRAIARQQLGAFNKCVAELSAQWRYFDHRRELLILQSAFLEGRYTESSKFGVEYRKKYPFDIDGAFWWILSEVRLKRVTDKQIQEIEAFWGDRPMVRALKVFYYSYLGKFTEAKASLDFITEIPYLAQEWGIFEFAQSWFRQTYSGFPNDDRADKLRQLAELQWPLAHLVKFNLPRDVVQSR